jgi:putative tryptophan/tyrosine transport system substrate-binding protein
MATPNTGKGWQFREWLPYGTGRQSGGCNPPHSLHVGEDPVEERIVKKLKRPGGNVTGFSDFANRLVDKQMGLLCEIVPKATLFAFLLNPVNPNTELTSKQADALAVELHLLRVRAGIERIIDLAFAAVYLRVGALLVGVDP